MTSSSTRTGETRPDGLKHRADIQGLRAVAVLVVLLYHTGLGPSGGFLGVDVFFVLSGFLITGLLIREHEKTGRIALMSFWARRARRLLPAAVLVVLATCAAARFWLPASRWEDIGHDAIAASTYFLNWRLAAESVDYLAEGTAAGPLQHFWSLAVEEQFYLLWPLLILALFRIRRRRVALGVIGAVVAGSFAVAVVTYGPQTYFTTHTRIWEMAAGALLAALMHERAFAPELIVRGVNLLPMRRPRAPRHGWLSWAGLVTLVGLLFVVTPDTVWPGPLTVLVVAATLLVLAFGRGRDGTEKLLSLRPLTWTGDISYSLYLWHWPLVVLAQVDGNLTLVEGLTIVALSFALAAGTYYGLEQPMRTAPFWAAARVGLAGGLAFVLMGSGAGTALAQSRLVDEAPHAPGARAILGALQSSATSLAPTPELASKDTGDVYARGCQASYDETTVKPCVFDYRSDGASGPTVVIVGDSKAAQWVPALEVVAREQHWNLISMTKAGCAFSDIRRAMKGGYYEACVTWQQDALRRIESIRPDLLVTSQLDFYRTMQKNRALSGAANERELVRGLTTRLRQMKDAGIPVVTIAETPRMDQDVPDCVSGNLQNLLRCSVPVAKAFANAGVVEAASRAVRVPMVDASEQLCTATTCPAVVGDVVVYRDEHHLTATFARSTAPFVGQELKRVVDDEVRAELFG
ncbi:acyltransferase family protein [Kineosporia succinea]|uniref:Peptidoglycan/LPS O-acetylase OafA/YrhL n=1 Tax=Kineosporia succinea TaxID=84632 RepID=A0ABT9P2H6_9ACTN|nr:acyltransferase family protein [Kineosporia succinea]MDP9826295.1 peptidoglycan/LPS O-acetylase OafA/YrhL [Kineosporia succinea]